MNPPSSTGNTMAMNNNYVTFLGLDLYQNNGSYNSLVLNGGNPITVENCLIHSTVGGFGIGGPVAVTAINNIIYNSSAAQD